MQLYHHAANFINNLQILKLARKLPDNVFYASLFPGTSFGRRRLAHTNIYLANINTYAILLLDRFLSLFEQCKLFQQSIHHCQTHYGISCIPKAGLRTKCPVCSCLDSLKLSSFFIIFLKFMLCHIHYCFSSVQLTSVVALHMPADRILPLIDCCLQSTTVYYSQSTKCQLNQ